jgi:hypothetical protein
MASARAGCHAPVDPVAASPRGHRMNTPARSREVKVSHLVTGATGLVGAGVLTSAVTAAPSGAPNLSNVATANPKSDGLSPASRLSADLTQLSQRDPSSDTGRLTMFDKGDQAYAGFDNVAFLSHDLVTFVEDAGDTLHTQRNALDSGFVFNVRLAYSNSANQPVRWLAEGGDPSATIDSANGGFGKNEGDNEITGAHVSDGDHGPNGILGALNPKLGDGRWRWFYTQQHGDNATFEVNLRPRDWGLS